MQDWVGRMGNGTLELWVPDWAEGILGRTPFLILSALLAFVFMAAVLVCAATLIARPLYFEYYGRPPLPCPF